MKKMMSAAVLVFFVACALTGCTRTEKVVLTTGDVTTAYEPLGEIQVEDSVSKFNFPNVFHFMGQMLIYNRYPTSGQSESLQGRLNKKLRKIARKRYGADAVINVHYWPDLNSAKFPKGMVYAKGDMVRYKNFPK